jgi:hypothetical protein
VSIRKLSNYTHPVSDDILDLSQYKIHNVKRLVSEDVEKQQLLQASEPLWVATPW